MNDEAFLKKQQQPRKATDNQLRYLKDLAVSKDWEAKVETLPPAWQELFHSILQGNDNVAMSDASKYIDMLKICHVRMPAPSIADHAAFRQFSSQAKHGLNPQAMPNVVDASLEDGMYMGPDPNRHIYKVYHTQRNFQVAKRLLIHEPKHTEDGDVLPLKGGHVAATFKYEGRAPLKFLKRDMRLSLTAAAEFGQIYGMCCLCGRKLTDELSIHLGIGPICGNREFGGDFKLLVDKAKLVLSEN